MRPGNALRHNAVAHPETQQMNDKQEDNMRKLLLFLAAVSVAAAQPTDAQIRAELMKSGAVEVRFPEYPGARTWNPDTQVFEFVRRVEVLRSTDAGGVKLRLT